MNKKKRIFLLNVITILINADLFISVSTVGHNYYFNTQIKIETSCPFSRLSHEKKKKRDNF
jgi:hypothetical protein